MRKLATFLLALGLCLPTGCSRTSSPHTSEELREHALGMNLLLVVLDAANAHHFSFMGYDRPTTPNIDRIAAEGVVFTNTYSQASATPLSMYSMMTSRYPILDKVQYPKTGELAAIIPRSMPTLPSWASEKFAARSAFVANRWLRRELGFDRGWTNFVKVYDQVPAKGGVPANLVSDAFLAWQHQNPASPWLGWIHYLEPHAPYTPPEPWFSKFDPEFRGRTDGTGATLKEWRDKTPPDGFRRNTIALYDGNLAWVDHQLGRVVDQLKADGVWDRTIVVITSDHGEAFWEHGGRGHGTHIYEEFTRVPLVIRVPGFGPRRIDETVEVIDVVPTLLDLGGVFVPDGATAGQSLVEVMTGESRPPEYAFFRNHKLAELEIGLRKGPFKYQYYYYPHPVEMFNLEDDPGEHENLVPVDRPVPAPIAKAVKALHKQLQAWAARRSGTDDGLSPSAAGADSLDQDTIEALRAIGYFGN